MSKRIYAGNLSYTTTEETLRDIFSSFGEIVSVNLIIDKDTQQSKGFGFIEFADDSAAEKAIAAQNGKELDGRKIRVSMAEEKKGRDASGNGFRRDGGRRNFDRRDRNPNRGSERSFDRGRDRDWDRDDSY